MAHDGTITAEEPDRMWGADRAAAVTTSGGPVQTFVAAGHCPFAGAGLHAAERGDRIAAPGPLRPRVRKHFAGSGANRAEGLAIGHGSDYLSDDSRRGPTSPGMVNSPSFAREPEGGGVPGGPSAR